MKTENTLENKAKFFAQYWGQEVVSDGKEIGGCVGDCEEDMFLELKPLSAITDEDAIEAAYLVFNKLQPTYARIIGLEIMFYHFTGTKQDGIQISDKKEIDTMTTHDIIVVYQYLQSKGYALPYMGLSVEDLTEYGWIKL